MGKESESCKEMDGKGERMGGFILVLLKVFYRNKFLEYNSKYFYFIILIDFNNILL